MVELLIDFNESRCRQLVDRLTAAAFVKSWRNDLLVTSHIKVNYPLSL